MKTITIREALNKALAESLREDPNVFLLGEDVAEYNGAYKITQGLLAEFGADRVIDTPISEHGFAGLAVGAAFRGLKPIVEFMTFNFGMQALDQIINSAAKTLYMSGGQMGSAVVFRGPNGAAARVGAQHSQCFASWYAHCPGLKVIAPYDAHDHYHLLKAAVNDPNPVIFLENEVLYGDSFVWDPEQNPRQIGQAQIMQEGSDVTIVTFSLMVGKVLQAVAELAKKNIQVEVINLNTIRPLDTKTIVNSVQKTNHLLVVEEGWPFAGIAAEVMAIINEQAFDFLDAPMGRVTGKDIPLPYAKNLENLALPQVGDIIQAVQKLLKK